MVTHLLVDVDGVINAYPESGVPRTWPEESWHHVKVGGRYPITYSSTAIAGLAKLATLPGVKPQWLTTWDERAPELLGPEIGLGADWEFSASHSDLLPWDWWKAEHVEEILHYADPGDRVVWIDDDLDSWSRLARPRGVADVLDDPRVLWVCPPTATGMRPEDLQRVRGWLDSPAL